MSAQFDAGPILAQQAIALPPASSMFAASAACFAAGARLLGGCIERLAAGERGTPQSGPGSYQSWPTRAQVRELWRRGHALLRLTDLAAHR